MKEVLITEIMHCMLPYLDNAMVKQSNVKMAHRKYIGCNPVLSRMSCFRGQRSLLVRSRF